MRELYQWLLNRIEQAETFDLEAERKRIKAEHPGESASPYLCGVLQYHLREVTQTARNLWDKFTESDRRKDALEWAAEHCLNDPDISTFGGGDVYELLYATADVIEHAMKGGMSSDDLRRKLRTEMTDEDRKAKRFLPKCRECKDSFDEEGETICESCRDIQDLQNEADVWNKSEAAQNE